MKPLLLVTIALLHVGYTLSQCPSTACTCETVTGQSRRNIRCVGLTQIPVFNSSPEIFQKLDMDNPNNNIQVIQANAFSGIKVEEIDMSGQNIKLQSIHPMAFFGLEQHLTIVKLQGDTVLAPPFVQLKNITNLQVLELQLFNMPTIEESTEFNYFPYLRTLRLRNMNTNFVSSESFKNQLQELTVFEFANNQVATFPKPAINRLRKLQHLSWVHNGMTTISYSSFDSLSSLIELDLRGNDIREMFNGSFIGITDRLEFLSLQLNRITKEAIIPLGNHNWPELEQLNLGHMVADFTDIPNGLFRNMPKLANLMMPGNKLKVIKSNDFQGLGNMHSLDLSENWIHTIQRGALSPMTRLDTLDLRSQYDSNVNNPMNFSLDALEGAELALKTLHIQDNHLIDQYAWRAIGAMKNLVNLDISGTGLSDIPSLLFYSHNNLGSLTMRNNNMTVLRQESLYGLKYSLEVIDISNNQIYTIEKCVFEGFNKLKFFFAPQNSFVCDCNLYGLHQILKAIPSPGLVILTCKNPANLAGKSLLTLETGQFCSNPPNSAACPDFTTTTMTTSTIGTTSVVPLPDIRFGISSETKNTIVISWTVSGDMTYLKNFLVQYKQLGINNPQEKSFPLDKSKRDHPITGLNPGSRYEICFFIELTGSSKQILISCPTGTTQGSLTDVATTEANTGSDDKTVEIVGGVLGGVLFIALIVVLLFVFVICRKKKEDKPPLPLPNGHITPIGYQNQPRPTSQPKVFVRKANGEMQVMTISNGNLDSSRLSGLSAGSYQNIDDTAVSNDPYPTKGATGGGGGRDPKQLSVKLPPEHKPEGGSRDAGRYTVMPTAPKPNYVNEVNRMMAPADHYTNAVETRPLPQTPNRDPMSHSSGGGFLNHGFSSSPTDKVYSEIQDNIEAPQFEENIGTVV
ncbi:insulin-like growth factor-binding protein complex acid labile subunit [Crassostrea angulata]|uniref:insulin-like growth factor-binding protein complex acid labile subunit n=1 Tax=Magallana angulata TaxID=2784310 RepID=UPI0022B0C2DA|nr:insulin-like growth factor-binding protein complex acid labile subunit [Crassostrea angulata]XP_052702148.1 insulin-like growth factor-binding protein complex acid labile subunit [Crassostrea angulata]